jgi:antitoxin component YwqK of YwqJK toxin-antitoxin module
MRNLFCFIIIFASLGWSHSQEILKENLSKPVMEYWDFEKTKVLSEGSYFVDFRGISSEKHGVWKYYDKNGNLEEIQNYYRNKLHGAVWQFYGKDRPKSEGYFKMGLQDSVFRTWHENGNLLIDAFYKSDLPFGTWNYFYATGDTMMVEIYRDSLPLLMSFYEKNGDQSVKNGNGTMQTTYSNGKPKDIYTFANGVKDGPFTEYHVAGHAEVTGFYKNGLKSGTWTHRFYTGQLHKIVTYDRGVLNGTYINYYDNEQVRVSGKYLNGLKDSTWTWFTNTGVVDMTGDFIEDTQHGDWVFNYPNGQCNYKGRFNMGKRTGTWVYYYPDGSRHRQGIYKDDVEDGRWQTWYESGKLLMDGVYAMGKEEGQWLNYWENGKIKNSGHFKKGVLHGKWESYFPNGTMNISGGYKNGLKSGPWIDYYSNGKARELVTYKAIKVKSKLNKTTYQESVRHGKYEAYSSKDFKLTEEGTFKNGKKDGLWIAYHPGGRLPAVTSEYKEGKLHGTVREYDFKSGKVMRSETQYKDGVKHGKMTVYDKRGKKIAEKFFDNGSEVKQNDFTPPQPKTDKKKKK